MATKTSTAVSPKVVGSTVAVAVVTILAWIAGMFGIDVPAEIQGAASVVLVFIAGYWITDPARGPSGGGEHGAP